MENVNDWNAPDWDTAKNKVKSLEKLPLNVLKFINFELGHIIFTREADLVKKGEIKRSFLDSIKNKIGENIKRK